MFIKIYTYFNIYIFLLNKYLQVTTILPKCIMVLCPNVSHLETKYLKVVFLFLLLNYTLRRSFVFNMYVGTYYIIDRYLSVEYNIENIIKKFQTKYLYCCEIDILSCIINAMSVFDA